MGIVVYSLLWVMQVFISSTVVLDSPESSMSCSEAVHTPGAEGLQLPRPVPEPGWSCLALDPPRGRNVESELVAIQDLSPRRRPDGRGC